MSGENGTMTQAAEADERALERLVDPGTFRRGLDYASRGAVVTVQRQDRGTRLFGEVQGTARRPYTALARLGRSGAGALTTFRGACTCPVGTDCKHAVALVLAAAHTAPVAAPGRRGRTGGEPAWARTLDALLPAPAQPAPRPAGIALQLQLVERGTAAPRLAARPVIRGRGGGWVRTGVTWSSLRYLRHYAGGHGVGYADVLGAGQDADRVALLEEIFALHLFGAANRYGSAEETVYLDTIGSRRIWDLLAEAVALDLPLVQPGRSAPPVTLAPEPAEVALDVRRAGSGLQLAPRITVGGEQVLPGAALALGTPVHGIAWWPPGESTSGGAARPLRLAALAAPLDAGLRALLDGGGLHIPGGDEARFLDEFAPRLRQLLPLTSADESVELPEPVHPVLALTIDQRDPGRARLAWDWCYDRAGGQAREPLWPAAGDAGLRDLPAERTILAAATGIAAAVPELLDDRAAVPQLEADVTLRGMALVRLVTEVLPRLATLPDVRVAGADALPDYREAVAEPVVGITGKPAPEGQDWFDLAVTVRVDGEDVPFQRLFVALAAGEEHLILPSGTYFRLDSGPFQALAQLIAEARALQDAPGDGVRVSRFQAGLWEELDRLGVISGQAAEWQRTVRALTDAAGPATQEPPAGLHAVLRPYQQAGFDWLAFLFEHRLGGILADDMGLGKTLQALALICRARERDPDGTPFLVVAPTSVVVNWAAEAERFAPGLRVVAVRETAARRGVPMSDVAARADLVITSYALFRIDYDDYAAIAWDGLILDEAQFVKNRQAQGYQCAKKLPAPFKLAITGTPMENNLMELWALLSITAPGLFPSPVRFEKFYRAPIEKAHDAGLLDQLRRRVRPLMLRRTKAQVLPELPDKQEQVLELELAPRHRRIYQTHLQRERQKILGLLGDLDKNRFAIFRSLTLLRQASLHAALIDPAYEKVASAKLDALMAQVHDVVADGHRVLVFSQFTRFLQLAAARVAAAGIEHCYLDGRTHRRADVIARFKSGSVPVFLISLKAGGFGLNLTEADYCILLDPWWNPATEAQAVDRVHRIGQANKVMVYRLVAKDTIEEKVMALKAAKSALFDSVLDADTFTSGALSAADVRGLLD